jgi:hypothetical protein
MNKVDYSDCFELITDRNYPVKSIILASLFSYSKWVLFLFKLRDILVAPFGLKTAKWGSFSNQEIRWEKGSYITVFEILEIADNEIAVGGKDSHLTGGLIVKKIKNNNQFHYYWITVVEYNNKLGKIYMAVIKPFHKLIVKNMIKRTITYKHHENTI